MKKLTYSLICSLFFMTFTTSCAQKSKETDKLPQSVTVVASPSAVTQDKILDAIKAPYKGKVVVIDFWATWCGPCMQAMTSIDPIKEEYTKGKKDVVFVYVTGETSPKANWDAAIKNIKGYHYRLSNAQYNNLLKGLGIMGIPTYMIIDKKGNVSYDNISTGGYPGDEIIRGEIDKALR